jgi:hypothetical protein
VGAALGRLGPEPMPAELAARLDAMFRAAADSAVSPADEPAASTADEPAGFPVAASGRHDARGPADGRHDSRGPADGRPARSAVRGTGRRMRWATPIAVAAGLFAFVGFGLDYLAGRSADNAADTAASMPESDAGGAGDAGAPASAAGSAAAGADPAEAQILNTGTDYTLATLTLEPQPRALSAPEIDASADSRTGKYQDSARASLGRLVARTALDACLAAIEQANAGGPLSVSSVDYARFEGRPAVVVRFSADNGRWAWASGPQCGAPGGGADVLGKVPVR